jgi:hypothetical protein
MLLYEHYRVVSSPLLLLFFLMSCIIHLCRWSLGRFYIVKVNFYFSCTCLCFTLQLQQMRVAQGVVIPIILVAVLFFLRAYCSEGQFRAEEERMRRQDEGNVFDSGTCFTSRTMISLLDIFHRFPSVFRFFF